MSLNRVILTGRLTRDPEFRASQSGVGVAKITVAVDNFYKKEKKTSFIDCTGFGKTAELLRDYFKKGSPIGIDGALHQENWEKDGEKKSKIVIYIEKIDFIGAGKEKPENEKKGSSDKSFNKKQTEHQNNDFDDSDLPF